MINLWRHREVLFAALLLLLCGAGSLATWQHIQTLAEPTLVLADDLPAGTNNFVLVHDGQCVGALETRLRHRTVYVLRASGSLNAVWRGAPVAGHLELEAFFNALGQLSRSAVTVSAPTVTLSLTSGGITPIRLRGQVETATGPTRTAELSLPGPLIIAADTDAAFDVSWSGGAAPHAALLDRAAVSVLGDVPLSIAPAGSESCPRGAGHVDLEPLTERLKGFAQPLRVLLGT